MKQVVFFTFSLLLSLSSSAQTFKQQFILASEIFGVSNLDVANLDDNQNLDIIASKGDKLMILNNATTSGIEDITQINLAERAFGVKSVDLDSDGDMDIICGAYFSDDFFYFIENDNNQLLDPVIITQAINGPIDNVVADLNQDQNPDIVVVSRFDDKIVWIKNNGSNTFSSPQNLISSVDSPSDIQIVDFDLDGHLDAIIMSSSNGYLRFFQNDGQLNFNQVYELNANFRNFFTVCDINNDGLPDVIADKTEATGSGVSYYQNLDNFDFEEAKISLTPNNVSYCSCADLNNDGNMDLIFSDFQNDVLEVHIGDGQGNFTDEILLEGEFSNPIITSIVDIDKDGDMDIIVADENDDSISLFENDLISGVENFTPEINYSFKLENDLIRLTTTEQNLNYEVLSGNGSLVKLGNFSNEHLLDIADLSTGVYFLRIQNSRSSNTHKFFKH